MSITEIRKRMKAYKMNTDFLMDLLNKTLEAKNENLFLQLKLHHKKAVIYGIGKEGIRMLNFLKQNDIMPVAFSDSNNTLWRTKFRELDVISPDKIDPEWVVCISNWRQMNDIVIFLKSIGLSNLLDLNFISWLSPEHNFKYISDNFGRINETLNYFNDDYSKTTFLRMMIYRLTLNPLIINVFPYTYRYLHPFVRPENKDIVVDGGAYDGDTIDFWNSNNIYPEAIYAFEPDEGNIAVLKKKYSGNTAIIPVPLGLYNTNSKMQFSGGEGSAGSFISENGSKSINTIKLDSFVENNKIKNIDLIKLDIEGAELPALQGALSVIQRFRPKLQICLYHQTEDFFEIPALVKKANRGYSIFIRHHSMIFTESILYAF